MTLQTLRANSGTAKGPHPANQAENLAADWPVDLSVLDPLPTLALRAWTPFSPQEVADALSGCSSGSTPGPDHITWGHWKVLMFSEDVSSFVL